MFAHTHSRSGPFGRRGGGFGSHHREEKLNAFRAGRGMMEPAILQALDEKPMHGYEIISTIEERSHGVWRPSAGSIYPTLQLLEEKDFITAEDKDGKKTYSLTATGKKEADEAKKLHNKLWEERIGSLRDMHAYRQDFGEIMKLMRTIFRGGTDQQKDQLSEAIQNFKHQLEEISEGDS